MSISRNNNFDLIRLIAALQVMIYHGLTYFEVNISWQDSLKGFVSYFPGVPIFFTISGFLIYRSLERNSSDLKRYFKNRLLRIYPALWVCFIFTIALLFISKQIDFADFYTPTFWSWVLSQITFFQFYKIPLVSEWGVGHPNGSLWSISVELQYYFFLPLLFMVFVKTKNSLTLRNTIIASIALISIIYGHYQKIVLLENEMAGNVMGVLLLKYLYFFCIGMLIYINFESIKHFLIGKGWLWLCIFLVFNLIFKHWLGYFDNVYETTVLGVLGETILALTTISLAFSATGLSNKLLGNNDISYGIYIYHMPLFNYFYHQQHSITWQKLLFVCFLVIIASCGSWLVIEQRMLRLKT